MSLPPPDPSQRLGQPSGSAPPPPGSAPLPPPAPPQQAPAPPLSSAPNQSAPPPPTGTPTSTVPPGVTDNFTCAYCRMRSVPTGTTCPSCGAPIDITRHTSGGWIVQPAIKDLARLQFGRSKAQISGKAVPVCDITLAEGESVLFFHTELLWKSGVHLDAVTVPGGYFTRNAAGMPRVIMRATGPGNVSLSADHTGEFIAVPLNPGQAIVASEHRLLAIAGPVGYTTTDTGIFISEEQDDMVGDVVSRYMNVYSAPQTPGLVLLHAAGNVLLRDLAPGEQISVQPASIVYIDPTVRMQLIRERTGSGSGIGLGGTPVPYFTVLSGPGRVAVTSLFRHIPLAPGRSSLNYNQLGGSSLGGLLGSLGNQGNQGGGFGINIGGFNI